MLPACGGRPAGRRAVPTSVRGFTLLELLIVMVIAGLTLGMVSFNAMPSERQILQKESQRIALLLQLARDEAIVRNRPIAFEASEQGYHFLMREENVWNPLTQDELLRDRQFQRPPVAVAITPAPQRGGPRVVFGREPVDKPFVLTLSAGESSVAIKADGIGHFTVQ
jgi:general secretion pathway protein H